MTKDRSYAPLDKFGKDVKDARLALGYSRNDFAAIVKISPRYLANIENSKHLPSIRVFFDLIQVCSLPAEKYFFPKKTGASISKQRERSIKKLDLCSEEYLNFVEATLDAALRRNTLGKH